MLHRRFPSANPLRLLLFKASGFHRDKKCQKASFHCVWPDLIVDKERAHVVRLQTIDDMNEAERGPSFFAVNIAAQAERRNAEACGRPERAHFC